VETPPLDGLKRCFEIGMSISKVRFEIVPLPPFVPGVNEDEPVIRKLIFCEFNSMGEPIPIFLRTGIPEDHAPSLLSWRIVPTGAYPAIKRIPGLRRNQMGPKLPII